MTSPQQRPESPGDGSRALPPAGGCPGALVYLDTAAGVLRGTAHAVQGHSLWVDVHVAEGVGPRLSVTFTGPGGAELTCRCQVVRRRHVQPRAGLAGTWLRLELRVLSWGPGDAPRPHRAQEGIQPLSH